MIGYDLYALLLIAHFQAHDDDVADAIDDINRSRQDSQVASACCILVLICCILAWTAVTISQLEAGKKLQQLHRRQLQLQHSVVVVQVRVSLF